MNEETTNKITEQPKPLEFSDVAALAIATVLWLAEVNEDQTIIDRIGSIADRVKGDFVAPADEPDTTE
jgi:hypothetical protein